VFSLSNSMHNGLFNSIDTWEQPSWEYSSPDSLSKDPQDPSHTSSFSTSLPSLTSNENSSSQVSTPAGNALNFLINSENREKIMQSKVLQIIEHQENTASKGIALSQEVKKPKTEVFSVPEILFATTLSIPASLDSPADSSFYTRQRQEATRSALTPPSTRGEKKRKISPSEDEGQKEEQAANRKEQNRLAARQYRKKKKEMIENGERWRKVGEAATQLLKSHCAIVPVPNLDISKLEATPENPNLLVMSLAQVLFHSNRTEERVSAQAKQIAEQATEIERLRARLSSS